MADGHPPRAPLPLSAIPQLPALPLVGSLPWVVRPEGLIARLTALGENHRGAGAFGVTMPGDRSPVFVVDADLATDLCDESRFAKDLDGPLIEIRAFAGDGLFTAFNDEPNWERAHRILTPGFAAPAMERYFPAMREVLGAMLGRWRGAPGPVDVVADTTRLTLDTIALAGFDHRFESFAQPALHPFLQSLGRALQEAADAIQRPAWAAPLFAARRRRLADDTRAMNALVDEVIRARRTTPESLWPKDFLSLMLTERDPKTGESLSDENIRYQILTFLIAGHETTSGLLSFALHALGRDPALAARARAEVDAKWGDREPTLRDVMALDLPRRVLEESLRLWPTVPALSRAAREDTAVAGRYLAPKGQRFNVLVSAVHRDPAVWPDPLRFDPDRFLPERAKARPAGAYKPFGIGRRACTGRHFALVEATLCLGEVLRGFELGDPGPLRVAPTLSPKPAGMRLPLRPR